MNGWPHTTQVLKDAGMYGNIETWTAKAAANQPAEYECRDSLQRGRFVDGGCNLILMNKSLDTPEWRAHDACCGPFLDGYRLFLREHKVDLIQCAMEVTHRTERYSGHIDQLVMLDDKRTLLDIKSGSMPISAPLQLASYYCAMIAMGMPRVARVGLLLTRGDYNPYYFNDPGDFDTWLIEVRHWWVKRSLGITAAEADILTPTELRTLADAMEKRGAAA